MKKLFKTNQIFLFIVLIICYSFTACDSDRMTASEGATNGIVVNVDDVNKNDIVKYSDLFESYEVVPLETKKECLIGKVCNIRLLQDYIVISDYTNANKVFLFDMKGNFVRQIGKQGKGPGEYVSPDAISTNEETGDIAVLDRMSKNILIYNLEGKFTKDISIEELNFVLGFEIFDNEIFLSCHNNGTDDYLLYTIDFDGNIINNWLPNENKETLGTFAVYSSAKEFSRKKNGLKFQMNSKNAIYSFEKDTIVQFITIISDKYKKSIDELMKERGDESDPMSRYNLEKEALIGPVTYSEISDISILLFRNGGSIDLLFYDENTGFEKKINWTNFQDDLTSFNSKSSDFFYTTNENTAVAPVQDAFLQEFVKNVKDLKITSESYDLSKITIESNPVLIFYKIKPNATLPAYTSGNAAYFVIDPYKLSAVKIRDEFGITITENDNPLIYIMTL